MSAERRRAGLELGAVALVLAILAALVYGPQAIHGGFLGDAWSNRALFLFSESHGFFGKIGDLLAQPNIAVRPLQAVYLVVLNSVFGSHVGFWLTWQVFTNVVMCVTLYLLLRRLSLSAIEAGTVAVLVLLFPAASSIRFWLATIWAPLSLSMVCGGFLLALSAFEAESKRRALILHGLSLALFVASVLLYEVALLILLCSVLLYLLRVPWRAAVQRWIADCVVLLIIVLTVTLSSDVGHESSEAGLLSHAKTIAEQAETLFTTIVPPLNSGSLVGAGAVRPAAGRRPRGLPVRAGRGRGAAGTTALAGGDAGRARRRRPRLRDLRARHRLLRPARAGDHQPRQRRPSLGWALVLLRRRDAGRHPRPAGAAAGAALGLGGRQRRLRADRDRLAAADLDLLRLLHPAPTKKTCGCSRTSRRHCRTRARTARSGPSASRSRSPPGCRSSATPGT